MGPYNEIIITCQTKSNGKSKLASNVHVEKLLKVPDESQVLESRHLAQELFILVSPQLLYQYTEKL